MDVHIPEAVTAALAGRGVDVLTAQADGTRRASDVELLTRATELGRTVFTQDEDFLTLALRPDLGPHRGVIFARQRAVSIGRCISDLELIAQAGRRDEVEGRVTYLPLR